MRVLVVEDEPRLLGNLAKALREEGYAVDIAAAGGDGLFKAESCDYDAIVLDVMLPVLDGWAVLERLRKKKSQRPSSCSPPATPPGTGCTGWTPAQTITWSSRSICRNCWPASGR